VTTGGVVTGGVTLGAAGVPVPTGAVPVVAPGFGVVAVFMAVAPGAVGNAAAPAVAPTGKVACFGVSDAFIEGEQEMLANASSGAAKCNKVVPVTGFFVSITSSADAE
jgi:hypothetical protein